MRRPIGLASAWLGAAVLVTANAASGLDLSYIPVPTEVVMKSLDTNLLVNGKVVNTRRQFLTYRVEEVRDDWYWLVAYQGTRGWAHRRDVVPADEAVKYFSEAVAREPRSAQAYRMRGLAHARVREYRRAVRDASEAIRLEPKLAPA
jgi:tetratricopeptide (TPR) repeat protein